MDQEPPRHFKTTNKVLALALVTAGCRWAPQEEGGPARGTYTPQSMRSKGMLPKEPVTPSVFEAAVRKCFEQRRADLVEYLIVNDALLHRCLKGWDEQRQEFMNAAHEQRAPIVPEVEAETVMRVLFVRGMNEDAAKLAPFFQSPLLVIAHSTETKTDERHSRIKGNAKSWTLNASEEEKRKLGVL